MRYIFARLDAKHKLLENIEKTVKVSAVSNCCFDIFWKIVTKNRAFGNNTNFYNNLYGFGGGGWSALRAGHKADPQKGFPHPPTEIMATHMIRINKIFFGFLNYAYRCINFSEISTFTVKKWTIFKCFLEG